MSTKSQKNSHFLFSFSQCGILLQSKSRRCQCLCVKSLICYSLLEAWILWTANWGRHWIICDFFPCFFCLQLVVGYQLPFFFLNSRHIMYSVRPARSCSSVPKLETGTPKCRTCHRKSKNYSRVEFITRPTECPTQPRRMIDASRVYTFI